MKPSLSIIFFTVFSGTGYGMLAWLGILSITGALPPDVSFGAVALAVSFVLFSAGLLASTLHLGRPERAWRAVTQWRTSWLSREGIASLLTYPPMLFFGLSWGLWGRPWPLSDVFGVIAAIMALATICCTAMIYASLKPIRQWHNPLVLPMYLANGLFGGALILATVAAFWPTPLPRLPGSIAILAGAAALGFTLAYWHRNDTVPGQHTAESATGLGWLGRVRMLEAPHTQENYLLREMGFAIGRKHAGVLRMVTAAFGYILPLLFLLGATVPASPAAVVLLPVASVLALLGLLTGRWLFFAQATHTVTLYYGRRAA